LYLDAVFLFGVAFRLFDLSDHPVIHCLCTPFRQ
jgi:hypothetical protein